MAKKYRLNIDTGVLHIIGNCYQTRVNVAHYKDFDTKSEAKAEYGEKVHHCVLCQKKEEKMEETK